MENNKSCPTCGALIDVNATVCPVCGAVQNNQQPVQPYSTNYQNQPPPQPTIVIEQRNYQNDSNQSNGNFKQSKLKGTAAVLAILPPFFGFFGIHRFYTGHIGLAIIQLLTAGGCGIWQLIDIIMILTGSFKDSDGKPLQ